MSIQYIFWHVRTKTLWKNKKIVSKNGKNTLTQQNWFLKFFLRSRAKWFSQTSKSKYSTASVPKSECLKGIEGTSLKAWILEKNATTYLNAANISCNF